ncbi:CDGSH iron-sulfur domain-containing protein [Sanguibacter sp. HDW7]|uniref:CDGSH iron-sulfur domain-containing protein n=1 Tax=Sanguibacter sp. HDW7 TaxID=2714931 RepID=UPI00140892D8|nr:CDGSH iron-sulfur domain-containing protein [Sanguibacter sp. HDW7]
MTLCPDGPILVRGAARIVTGDGRAVARNRPTIALCRCGGSAIKPFCDGTHKVNGFTSDDPTPPSAREGGCGGICASEEPCDSLDKSPGPSPSAPG